MLELVKKTYEKSQDGCFIYLCKCQCGNLIKISSSKFNKDRVKSCGCLKGKSAKHGRSKHPLYARYKTMLARCNNPKNKSYKNYGAKGIKVCKRWSLPMPRGFDNFVEDMGDCPEGFSLERINNDRGYMPSNCKWASIKEQSVNKTSNNKVTIEGVTKTLSQWSEDFECSPYRVQKAIKVYSNLKDIKEYCKSELYINNKSGYSNICFISKTSKWRLTYKDKSGINRYRYVNTLNEAVNIMNNVKEE